MRAAAMLSQTQLHHRAYIGDALVTIWLQRAWRRELHDKVTSLMGIAFRFGGNSGRPSTAPPSLGASKKRRAISIGKENVL